jgi:hypothetical protein
MNDATTQELKDRPQTLGESRVRLTFNPNGHPEVELIKKETAAMIDFLHEWGMKRVKVGGNQDETLRLISLAQTHYEDAAMWAVKAVTG